MIAHSDINAFSGFRRSLWVFWRLVIEAGLAFVVGEACAGGRVWRPVRARGGLVAAGGEATSAVYGGVSDVRPQLRNDT